MKLKNPKLTADAVVVKNDKILLIRRGREPHKGLWALPGGFVEYGETVEDATIREMQEETGLKIMLEGIVGVYSDPSRDPRCHTVTIAYHAKIIGGNLAAADDASDAKWFNLEELPEIAFDHARIIGDAISQE